MRTSASLLLPLNNENNIVDLVTDLRPLLWFRFRDASGSFLNSGSVGSSDAAVGAGSPSYAQVGKLGGGEAVVFPANTRLDVPYAAGWADITTFEWSMLIKVTSSPANSRLLGIGAPGYQLTRQSTDSFLSASARNTTPTVFNTTASDNALSLNTYYMVNMAYDDAGDRKIYLYLNGVETTNSLQEALTGTFQTPTSGMAIGNNAGLAVDFIGEMDEVIMTNFVWTQRQRLTLKTAYGL